MGKVYMLCFISYYLYDFILNKGKSKQQEFLFTEQISTLSKQTLLVIFGTKL